MKTIQYLGIVLLFSVCLASCCEPQFVSINPEEVQRGDTDVQMVLTANKCTFFQDTGIDDIIIAPYDEFNVHDIIVEDNATVSFMIDVPEDAQLGHYTLTVVYDNGSQFIIGVHVLTVVE